MAVNPPQTAAKHDLLGIPIWGWALGLVAFLVGVFVIFRQKSTAGTSTVTGQQVGYGVPVPVPFSTSTTPQTTSSQNFEINIRERNPSNQWDWPQGPPIYSDPKQPMQSIVGYVPFGATEQSTGPIVQGGSIAGITTYYPVQGPGGGTAYVSGADVLYPQNTNSISSGTMPAAIGPAIGP